MFIIKFILLEDIRTFITDEQNNNVVVYLNTIYIFNTPEGIS